MTVLQNEIKKTSLINTAGLLPSKATKLLISCCNVNGGLYIAAFTDTRFTYKKIIDGDCRGIAKYKDGFVIPSNTYGLLLLDHNFNIVSQYKPDSPKDYHGVAVEGDYAYVVETSINAIGKYMLPALERIDELVLDPRQEDICHVNDIFILGNDIYLSMFTNKNKWRDSPVDSGVVVKADLKTLSNMEVLYTGLKHPHSIRPFNGSISLCNSSNFEVMVNGDRIFKSSGYLRGIEKIEDTYFFGQSESRNVDWIRRENTNISVDSGIHVFHAKEQISRFYSLPSPEIYAILDCGDTTDQSFYDNIELIETPQRIDILTWQLYIDTGDGFIEEQSLSLGYSTSNNSISIDLSNYSNIKALRFDPINAFCLMNLKSIAAITESGTEPLLVDSHNAILINENQYYFNHNDPQLIVKGVNPSIKNFTISFDLYTDCIEIGNQMTNQIYQTRHQLNSQLVQCQQKSDQYRQESIELRNKIEQYRKESIEIKSQVSSLSRSMGAVNELSWRMFIDTGHGFSDTKFIQDTYHQGRNNIIIDLLSYRGVKSVRFNPADLPCVCCINKINAITHSGSITLSNIQHNARFKKGNYHYFNQDYPQFIFLDLPSDIKAIEIDFELYAHRENIECKLTELLDQYYYETKKVKFKDKILNHLK